MISAEREHQDDDDGQMDEINSEVFQKETRASNSLNSHMYNSHEFDAHRRFDCNATNALMGGNPRPDSVGFRSDHDESTKSEDLIALTIIKDSMEHKATMDKRQRKSLSKTMRN